MLILYFALQVKSNGQELVGIFPFSNQRSNQSNDWLGYYIQAGLEVRLRDNSDWLFHNMSVLRLWQNKSKTSYPVSHQNSILITGSFQQVLRLGFIHARIKRISDNSSDIEMDFETSFTDNTLAEILDELSIEIGKWIHPGFKLENKSRLPAYRQAGVKEVLRFRQVLFEDGGIPEIRHVLELLEFKAEQWPDGFIGDLVEGMIILSRDLATNERNSVLNTVETVLRAATRKNRKSSRLYSLLAECYYLQGLAFSWVQAAANKSIKLDPQNDLGYVMLALASDSTSDVFSEALVGLNKVNPWIWPKEKAQSVQFQKGILRTELFGLIQDK